MTIDMIEVSPRNVRRHRATIEDLASMEASILGSGLIQPLNVHPMLGSKKYGAFAGGRRTRAIKGLVKRGVLPADFPVRVEVYRGFTDVEIIELSMGENLPRADLEVYELCAATRSLITLGEPIDRIAHALGQPLDLVRKWQRVGQLAEPIFEAFAQGVIGEKQAQAYAATADQALQLAAWKEIGEKPDWQRGPEYIRAALKVGDRQLEKLLRLVGDDAYTEAGGTFELDLFADVAGQRGRVVDEGTLRQLAEARFVQIREETRAQIGRDIRFAPQPPQVQGRPDYNLQVPARMVDGKPVVPDGDVVAVIEIGDAGEPEVTYWWESRKAKSAGAPKDDPKPIVRPERSAGAAIDDRASPGATQQANEEIREETGITPATIQIFRSLRRVISRALFVRDARKHGTVGLDYLVWAQLRMMLRPERHNAIGMTSIGALDIDTEEARAEVQGTEASREWRQALFELSQQTFITDDDFADAFLDYRASAPSLKLLAAAAVSGLALARSLNAGTYRLPVHDAVAGELDRADDATIRTLWAPSADLLDRIPAHQRLAIADPFVERVTFGAWQRLKSADLTARVLDLVLGRAASAKASMADAARTWVHPLLSFTPPEQEGDDGDPGPANDVVGADLAEAAE